MRLTLPWKWESLSDDSSTLRVTEVALLEMEGVCGDYLFGDGYQHVTSSTYASYLKQRGWAGGL